MTRAAPETTLALTPPLELLRRVWRINHALEQLSSRMEHDLGVTAQQRLLLRCVELHPRVTSAEVASLLHLDPGTVSASVHRLEELGWLARHRDETDRRCVTLTLTRRGQALVRRKSATVESAATQLLREASEPQRLAAQRFLDALAASLESAARPREKTKTPARASHRGRS